MVGDALNGGRQNSFWFLKHRVITGDIERRRLSRDTAPLALTYWVLIGRAAQLTYLSMRGRHRRGRASVNGTPQSIVSHISAIGVLHANPKPAHQGDIDKFHNTYHTSAVSIYLYLLSCWV